MKNDRYAVEVSTKIGELPIEVYGIVQFTDEGPPYVEIETITFDGNRLIPEILVGATQEKLEQALIDGAMDLVKEERFEEQRHTERWRL